MGTWANIECPDEMPHTATFHQGMRCLLIQDRPVIFLREIITCNPSICTIDHLDLTIPNIVENFIGPKMINQGIQDTFSKWPIR